jgi:hypothetical protein
MRADRRFASAPRLSFVRIGKLNNRNTEVLGLSQMAFCPTADVHEGEDWERRQAQPQRHLEARRLERVGYAWLVVEGEGDCQTLCAEAERPAMGTKPGSEHLNFKE